MVRRNLNGAAQSLGDEVRKQLAEALQPIRKDVVPIYRGSERMPILSLRTPARGPFTAHAIKQIGECAMLRNLESRYPQALRALSAAVPGYIVMEPINVYDPNAPDQYPLNWYKGNRQVYIDLLAILQPRNLQVPPGFVFEIPVSIEELPGAGYYLLLHTGAASLRPEKEVAVDQGAEPVTKVASGKQPTATGHPSQKPTGTAEPSKNPTVEDGINERR